MIKCFAVLLLAVPAWGQATTSAPATSEPSPLENPAALVERKLATEIDTVEWRATPLGEAIDFLAKSTHTNLVVNWPALEKAGLTRQTPVTFRARKIPYEQVLRVVLEGLGSDKGRLNYAVSEAGGGLIEVSTMEGFGKNPKIALHDMRVLLKQSFEGGAALEQKAQLLATVVEEELIAAGEAESKPRIRMDPSTGRLALMASERAQDIAGRTRALLMNPIRPPQLPQRAVVTAKAKKAEDRLKEKVRAELKERTLDEVAVYLSDVGKQTIVLMPNSYAPAVKAPAIAPQESPLGEVLERVLAGVSKDLAYEVSPAGLVVVGTKKQLAQHDVLAAYDVRALLQQAAKTKRATPASAGALGQTLAKNIATRVAGEAKRGAWFYEGTLIVRASAGQLRELAPELATKFETFLK